MKKLICFTAFVLTSGFAFGQSLLLDFGATTAASPYLTTSPGHAAGAVSMSDTSWNTITTSAPVSSLIYGNGASATGITLSMGEEATPGDNIINYSTAIEKTTLAGSGGAVAGQQSLLGIGSIYGDNTASTAVGRDGFFGGGTTNQPLTQKAIGLRIDGLAAGDYVIYVMARNTNSNASSATSATPMNIYTSVGASSGTFDFSSLTAVTEANTTYASATYAGEYNTFQDGNNYVGVLVSIAAGQSLYLSVDGGNSALESRGFLNMVEVVTPVPVPESSTLGMLGLAAGLFLIVVRRPHTA